MWNSISTYTVSLNPSFGNKYLLVVIFFKVVNKKERKMSDEIEEKNFFYSPIYKKKERKKERKKFFKDGSTTFCKVILVAPANYSSQFEKRERVSTWVNLFTLN